MMDVGTDSQHVVLVVEDSNEDYESLTRAFKKTKLAARVIRCTTGSQAVDYLRRKDGYSDPRNSPRPSLILLDLNLPGGDGKSVIMEIKGDEILKSIPVVMMSTSSDTREVHDCYKAGACGFVHKVTDFKEFSSSIQCLKNYWLEVVLLPKEYR